MGEDPACVVLVLWQVGEHLDGLATLVLRQVQVRLAKLLQQVQNASCKIIKNVQIKSFLFRQTRKEGNVLFNDALNTYYLWLYSVRHMVKDHSDSKRGNPLLPHGLLFLINSKGSFIYIILCTCTHPPNHTPWKWSLKHFIHRLWCCICSNCDVIGSFR